MADFTKQSWEEFRIDVDFGLNMEEGEELNLTASDIKCVDKDGTDVTTTLVNISTKLLITGSQSGLVNSGLQVQIKGGTEAGSVYKYTFYGVTDASPPNKFEKDIKMKIKER